MLSKPFEPRLFTCQRAINSSLLYGCLGTRFTRTNFFSIPPNAGESADCRPVDLAGEGRTNRAWTAADSFEFGRWNPGRSLSAFGFRHRLRASDLQIGRGHYAKRCVRNKWLVKLTFLSPRFPFGFLSRGMRSIESIFVASRARREIFWIPLRAGSNATFSSKNSPDVRVGSRGGLR